MTKLPKGWASLPAGEIGDWEGGGTPSKSNLDFWTNGTIPWVSPKDMKRSYIGEAEDYITEAAVSASSTKIIPPNAVLVVTRSGILQHSLPVALTTQSVAINQDLKALTLSSEMIPDYVLKHFQADADAILQECVKSGTTVESVDFKSLKAYPIRIAPRAEQKRIVAKIDGFKARSTRAQTHLEHIPALVEKYKSAIFSLAFSGQLTLDLRGDEVTENRELPDSWAVKRLGDIGEIQGGIQVGKKRNATTELVEVPYLRVANVQRGWLNLDEMKSIFVTPVEKARLVLKNGDVLMNEGGDRDKLGRGWVWEDQIEECIHQNHVFRIRIKNGVLPPKFVSHYANEKGQQYFIDKGTQTTNLASISMRKVTALPIPVPPLEEATEIVRRIDAVFDWLDRITVDHVAAVKLLAKLDTAILAKAFRGDLVPQFPDDEHASILVARIQAEYNGAPTPRHALKRQKRKDATKMVRNLEEVLAESTEWLPAQEAFRRCGIADGAETDVIETLYAELRALAKAGRLDVEPVADAEGRKLYDKLKLVRE